MTERESKRGENRGEAPLPDLMATRPGPMTGALKDLRREVAELGAALAARPVPITREDLEQWATRHLMRVEEVTAAAMLRSRANEDPGLASPPSAAAEEMEGRMAEHYQPPRPGKFTVAVATVTAIIAVTAAGVGGFFLGELHLRELGGEAAPLLEMDPETRLEWANDRIHELDDALQRIRDIVDSAVHDIPGRIGTDPGAPPFDELAP